MRPPLVIALVCLFFVPPLAGTQAARQLSPDEAVRLALEQNAGLRIVRAERDAVDAAYRQTRAGRLPALRSQGSYTRLSGNIPDVEFGVPDLDTTFTLQPVELNRYQAELNLEQPLFTGFRLSNSIRAAARAADAAAHAVDQQQVDVALAVRRAYWSLFRAIRVQEAVDASLVQVEEHLRDVRDRLEAGTALQTDFLSARTRRAEVLLERIEAENGVRVAELELNRLVGLPLGTSIDPVEQADEGPRDPADQPVDDAALADNPRLLALQSDVAGLEARVRAARGSWLPQLGFLGRLLYARPNPYFFLEPGRFHVTWEVGLTARWDLWVGGRRTAEISEQRALLRGAEARLAEARQQAAVNLARQQLELRRAAEAVDVAGQNVTAAEEAFRVARARFGEGAALSIDVLDSEQAARLARSRRAAASADLAIARASLLHALGRIW